MVPFIFSGFKILKGKEESASISNTEFTLRSCVVCLSIMLFYSVHELHDTGASLVIEGFGGFFFSLFFSHIMISLVY